MKKTNLGKMVQNTNTGEIFISAADASRSIGKYDMAVAQALLGSGYIDGQKFVWLEDEDEDSLFKSAYSLGATSKSKIQKELPLFTRYRIRDCENRTGITLKRESRNMDNSVLLMLARGRCIKHIQEVSGYSEEEIHWLEKNDSQI